MDVGVYTFATDRDIDPGEFARAVEDRGFAALMLTEHSHIPAGRDTPYPAAYGGGVLPDFYRRTYDPFVGLSFAAAATTRLRIGTGICLVALRDPVHTAKEVASLDRLSGGRFVFGVGFGWNADEFRTHGVHFGQRHAIVAEKVALMKQLWTEDVASYAGDHVNLQPSWAWPKPVTRPHPPVHLGGNGPVTMRHAAAWADCWYPTPPLADPTLARSIPRFRELVAAAGRDPDTVPVGVAPATVDAHLLAAYAANGVAHCNVAVLAPSRDELLTALDTLAAVRDETVGRP
ncbi:MAG TPA: LLM class F420-dependent oxidoreductase [Mycobacteriales bacterium]|nr:LLM class F420-dependent oxidoreductase [Mycobacteriales bacterium]